MGSITDVKLFGDWDCSNINIKDKGLERYINLEPRYVPHSAGRHEHKRFHKSNVHVVERLANKLMSPGKNTGKKLKVLKIVKNSLNIIEHRTGDNPIQILVDAIVNASGSEAIRQTVLGSDIGPAIVDYLGNNPDELEEIADKSQLEQARVLGRIEAKLEAKPVKKVSSAPAPTRSSKGSATGKVGSGGKYGGYGSWKEFCIARKGK